jgi:hypothetical protein
MRKAGVVFIGWLPNTTSKSQLADVSLFGAFKTTRERLETAWAGKEKRTVDRHAKIEIASRAMVETFTRERIAEGAMRTGMLPIDRQALLKNASIKDGDALRKMKDKEMASAVLDVAQRLPASHLSPETPSLSNPATPYPATPFHSNPATPSTSFDGHDDSPLLDTPLRMTTAESTYTSISKQQPRIGPIRLIATELEEDPEELNRFREQVTAKFEELDASLQTKLVPMYTEKFKKHATAQITELEKQKELLEKRIKELDKERELHSAARSRSSILQRPNWLRT